VIMNKIVEWVRVHFLAALTATGLVSAAGGAILNDFTSWRNANRDFLNTQADASLKADQDLIDILRKFSNKALGKDATTPDDLKALQANIAKSYLVASALKDRIPSLKTDIDAYAEALFALQKTAEKMTGPVDAQAFVEAVSAFGDRRQAFQKRIASMQTSWPL
jgi:hypothetical protein